MRDMDRRALLANGLTATALTLAAATIPASGHPSAPLSAPALRSPRARRLLDLYRCMHDVIDDPDHTDLQVDAVARDIYAVMDDIEASPAKGVTALEEYAATVLYWYRPEVKHASGSISGGIEYCEGCCVTFHVLALVNTALSLSEGGADAA